jgi:hypothetical protein
MTEGEDVAEQVKGLVRLRLAQEKTRLRYVVQATRTQTSSLEFKPTN